MSEFEGNLRGVLNCVETLVKNIRRRRELIEKAIDGKQCVSTKQLSDLLTTFVDQILDDSDKTSEEDLCKTLSEEPHKEVSTDVNAHKLIENELRQRIHSLEDSLKKETEDKQRIQKHCSKIMKNCLKTEDNHKNQIQALNETIENLKRSECEDVSTDVNQQKVIENELRQRILSLVDSLKKETENKQMIQIHISKFMENLRKSEEHHKSQIQTLNETIENSKKSESELKTRINELENRPNSDPMIEILKYDLRQQIRSLEDSLKKETEDKQRIQKHCSEVMENSLKTEDNFKNQIQELKKTIENLKSSESDLKTRITEFENKPKSDPIIEAMKCEVKKEILLRTAMKKEKPLLETNLNGFHNKSEEQIEESEEIEAITEDQTLRDKCLASKLSITLERVDTLLDKQNSSIVEEGVDDSSEVESIIDLTNDTNKESVIETDLTDDPYVVMGRGRGTRYYCSMEMCFFECRTTDEIISHIHSCHYIQVNKFDCNYCSRLFLSRSGLNTHEIFKHGKNRKRRQKTTLNEIY